MMKELYLIPHVLKEKNLYVNYGELHLTFGEHPPFLYPLKKRLPPRTLLFHMNGFLPLSSAPKTILSFLFFREKKGRKLSRFLTQLSHTEFLIPSHPTEEPKELWRGENGVLLGTGESARYFDRAVWIKPKDQVCEITGHHEMRITGKVKSETPYFIVHSTESVPIPFSHYYIELIVDPALYHAKFFLPENEPPDKAVNSVLNLLKALELSPSPPDEITRWKGEKEAQWPSENSLFCF